MTKEKIDLGKAFDKLKEETLTESLFRNLVKAEKLVKSEDPYKYARAFGILSGCITAVLVTEGTYTFKDIDNAVAPDDKTPIEILP